MLLFAFFRDRLQERLRKGRIDLELGKIEVSGVNAKIVCRKRIPRGIVGGTVEIRYTDPIWDSLTKTVVFRGSCVKDVMNPGSVVQIPAEVVADAGSLLQVGVYGVDAENNLVIPTLWADLGYIESSADPSGDEAADPQLPVWAQLQEQIGDLSKLETEDKSSLVAAVNEARKTDKTFGDETVYYEWNEETEYNEVLPAPAGLDQIANQFAKISDDAPKADFFVGKYFRGTINGEKQTLQITEDVVYPVSDLVYIVADVIFVVSGEETVEGIGVTFTKGIWVLDDFKEDASLRVDTWQILDPATLIDEKYIPDTIARTADVIVAPAAASVGQVLAVKAIDEKGRPTEWEAVDMAKDGSEGTGSSTNGDLTEPADDDIPNVYFIGKGGMPFSKDEGDVQMLMRYISKTATIERYCTAKVQGSSSASNEDYKKRNWTIKVYTDSTYEEKEKLIFKGWPAMNKFVLKAGWVTPGHLRNVGAAKIWGQIMRSRSDYDTLPDELRNSPNQGATDGFHVRVFINGMYWGIYDWIVAKDQIFGQDKDNPAHSILNSEWNNQPTCAFATTTPTISGNWSEELQDDMTAETKTSMENWVKFVAGSGDEEFVANAEKYFDVQSVIDAICFDRIIMTVDNMCRNQIVFKYDTKWFMGKWDLDAILGLPPVAGQTWYTFDTAYQEGYVAHKDFGIINMLYDRTEKLFLDRFKENYWRLRSGPLSESNLVEVFGRLSNRLRSIEGLQAEENAGTTGNGQFTGMPNVSTDTIQQIREMVVKRCAYMDEVVENMTIGEPVPCTGIALSVSELTFTGAGTQTLTATVTPEGCTDVVTWESNDPSVVSVSGGVVTALANGSTTITARCGDYSASCAVTVDGFETTGAKYQFANGTFTGDREIACIVSNGNHVRFPELSTSVNNGIHGIDDTGVHSWSESKDSAWFIIPNGTTIELKLNNMTAAAGDSLLEYGIATVSGANPEWATWSEESGDNWMSKKLTSTADYYVKWVVINPSGYFGSTTLEFDVELTVNGERWI